jgi:hypothetical protein
MPDGKLPSDIEKVVREAIAQVLYKEFGSGSALTSCSVLCDEEKNK